MQSVFKCDHCNETHKVPELIIAHEIDCSFNPKNKVCWSCKHNSPDYDWYVCDKKYLTSNISMKTHLVNNGRLKMLSKSELKQWTDALRSGQYTQGEVYLKQVGQDNTFNYCCLGLFCELQGIPNEPSTFLNCFEFGEGNYKVTGVLTPEIANKFFVSTNIGLFRDLDMPDLGGYVSLASANDNGVSFGEIADHLDKHYPAIED